MLRILSVIAFLSFSVDLGACKIISSIGTVVGTLKEVVSFSSDKFLSNGAPKSCCKPLYKHVLLSAAVHDSWKNGINSRINKMPTFPKYLFKIVKEAWNYSLFGVEVLVGTECFYLFRLSDTPTKIESVCAIAGALAGVAVTLNGIVKIWSYVWPLFRRSNKNWVDDKVGLYWQERGNQRKNEKAKDKTDETLFQ